MNVDDNKFPKLLLKKGTPPASPASDSIEMYADANGVIFAKDSTGAAKRLTTTRKTVTNTATLTPDATDAVCVASAQAQNLTLGNPALASPTDEDTIVFKIKATGAYTLAVGSAYSWIVVPITTLTSGKWHYLTAIYSETDAKWHITGAVVQA